MPTNRNIEAVIHEIYRSNHKIWLKHDIACRKITRSLRANSVSILLYNGASNQLECRGRYIDPSPDKANARPDSTHNQEEGSIVSILEAMKTVDFWEFAKLKGCTPDPDMYIDYRSDPRSDKMVTSKKKFAQLTESYSTLYPAYKQYKRSFILEKHPVGIEQYSEGIPESLSGMFYWLLHHRQEDSYYRKKEEFIQQGGGKIFVGTNICVSNMTAKPPSIGICRRNLLDNLHVFTDEGNYYVGVPLKAPTNRLIGLMRIVLGENTVITIANNGKPWEEPNPDTVIEKIHNYLVTNFRIEELAYIVGEKLHNYELLDGFRTISLKRNLNQEFKDHNKLAEEIAAVINCYGSVIRTSDGHGNARILGYSPSVKEYINVLGRSTDPYIEENRFSEPLIALFYGGGDVEHATPQEKKRDIVSVKIKLLKGSCSISYQYINDKQFLVEGISWKKEMEEIESGLKHIFLDALEKFTHYDIKEIVILPIKEIKYGFVTLANRSVHPFVLSDIEMIIPVVRRVGFEYQSNLQHKKDIERWKQETLIHSTRIMFHQLGSPIVSLRNHIANIRHKRIPEDKIPLRLQEMELTYQDFLDMLATNQFFFEYLTKGKTQLEIEEFNLFELVKDRVRTYQLRAKKDRGIDISIAYDSKLYGVTTDKRLLGHVIQSLVDNAIKYSFTAFHRDEPWFKDSEYINAVAKWIIVGVENTVDYFSISVTNWGASIEADEINEIKKLEYRGRAANNYATLGSGIGLYVVSLIVEEILKGILTIEHVKQLHRTTITVLFNKRSI